MVFIYIIFCLDLLLFNDVNFFLKIDVIWFNDGKVLRLFNWNK